MTVAVLATACRDLLIFLSSLINLQGNFSSLGPEFVGVAYIISKLVAAAHDSWLLLEDDFYLPPTNP